MHFYITPKGFCPLSQCLMKSWRTQSTRSVALCLCRTAHNQHPPLSDLQLQPFSLSDSLRVNRPASSLQQSHYNTATGTSLVPSHVRAQLQPRKCELLPTKCTHRFAATFASQWTGARPATRGRGQVGAGTKTPPHDAVSTCSRAGWSPAWTGMHRAGRQSTGSQTHKLHQLPSYQRRVQCHLHASHHTHRCLVLVATAVDKNSNAVR